MAASFDYQVAILGGGPAGCATALALTRRGLSGVLMVEPGQRKEYRVGESLPPDTRLVLQQLGVCEAFLREGHDPCFGSCSSWGDPALGYNDFLFNPHGSGWHLDRSRFDAFMARETELAGAELATGLRFKHTERIGDDGFRLCLVGLGDQAREVSARFVVDATGQRAVFARKMGARRRFLDRLVCVYGFFELGNASGVPGLTMLEAVEYGWWYAARLPKQRLAAAVASDPEVIRGSGLHVAKAWLGRLSQTRYMASWLDRCRYLDDSLLIAPAPSFQLNRVTGRRWLAVGDAASAFDPISSQGIHKALSNGLLAAEAIAAFLGGDGEALERYGASIAARFEAFTKLRDHFYGLEKRWPGSPFWQKRQVVRDA